LTSWFSNTTLTFLNDESTRLVEGDYTFRLIKAWVVDRWDNFFDNINIVPFTWTFTEMLLVTMLDSDGKFSFMSPMVYAWGPTTVVFIGTLIQFFFGLARMNFWAKGNITILALQVYSVV
jgi:hypothetical protein